MIGLSDRMDRLKKRAGAFLAAAPQWLLITTRRKAAAAQAAGGACACRTAGKASTIAVKGGRKAACMSAVYNTSINQRTCVRQQSHCCSCNDDGALHFRGGRGSHSSLSCCPAARRPSFRHFASSPPSRAYGDLHHHQRPGARRERLHRQQEVRTRFAHRVSGESNRRRRLDTMLSTLWWRTVTSRPSDPMCP